MNVYSSPTNEEDDVNLLSGDYHGFMYKLIEFVMLSGPIRFDYTSALSK